jgi:hypothetical protein
MSSLSDPIGPIRNNNRNSTGIEIRFVMIVLMPFMLLILLILSFGQQQLVYADQLISPSVIPYNSLVNAKSIYEIKFSGSITDICICKILIGFPAGFEVSGAQLIETDGTINGANIRTGTLSISAVNRLIIFASLDTGVVPRGSVSSIMLRIELAGIVNPINAGNPSISIAIADKDDFIRAGPIPATVNIKQISSADLANGAVTTDKITDGQIGTLDLANNAVTNTKIADGAVTAGKIVNGAVTGSKISGTTKLLFGKCVTDISIAAHSNSFFTCSLPGATSGDQVIATYNGNPLTLVPFVHVSSARVGSGIVNIYNVNEGNTPVSSKAQEFSVIVFRTLP